MGDGCPLPPKQPAVFVAPLGVRREEAGWKFQCGAMGLCLQQQEKGTFAWQAIARAAFAALPETLLVCCGEGCFQDSGDFALVSCSCV